VKKLSFVSIMFCFAFSPAIAWSLFGPSTYDECILDKLDSAMSDTQVAIIMNACQSMFPSKKIEKKATEAPPQKIDYESCGLDPDHWKTRMLFPMDYFGSVTYEILERLKNTTYDATKNTIGFQNKNDFGISAVKIGFTSSSKCPRKAEDYAYSTICQSISTDIGVPQNTYGTLQCGLLPLEAARLSLCHIGYSPVYDQFDNSLLTFLKSKKYCE